MKVFTDCDIRADGFPDSWHYVDIDPKAEPTIMHPDGSGELIRVLDALIYLNDHPEARDKAGWHEISKIPSLPEGTTRWDVFVRVVNSSRSTDELRAIGFTNEV